MGPPRTVPHSAHLVEAALLPRGGGLLGGGPISARGAIRGCSTVPRIHILLRVARGGGGGNAISHCVTPPRSQ